MTISDHYSQWVLSPVFITFLVKLTWRTLTDKPSMTGVSRWAELLRRSQFVFFNIISSPVGLGPVAGWKNQYETIGELGTNIGSWRNITDQVTPAWIAMLLMTTANIYSYSIITLSECHWTLLCLSPFYPNWNLLLGIKNSWEHLIPHISSQSSSHTLLREWTDKSSIY